jgi:hypothetical protein
LERVVDRKEWESRPGRLEEIFVEATRTAESVR